MTIFIIFVTSLCLKLKDITLVAVSCIELVAKWSESFKGQSDTFDMDFVESLNGMASKLRALRSLLCVLNLENHIMFKKNKVFAWLRYLKKCYPDVHDLLYRLTFEEYSIHQHMTKEHERKKSINKKKLLYYCERMGVVGDRKKINLSNSQKNNKASKANKGNLNYIKTNQTASQTKHGRRIRAEENKKRKKREKERKEAMKALNRNKNNKQSTPKKKKVKIKDLMHMANINETIMKYGLFVENVMHGKKNECCMDDTDFKIDDGDLQNDIEEDEDQQLIDECMDEISETESDDDQMEMDCDDE